MTSPHPEVGGSVPVQPHARGETKGPPPRPDASSSQAFTVYVSGEKTHCEETDSKKKEKKKRKKERDRLDVVERQVPQTSELPSAGPGSAVSRATEPWGASPLNS